MTNTYQCPHCHNLIEASPMRGGGAGWGVPYQQQEMRVNKFGAGESRTATQSVRSVPVSGTRSFESHFSTPFAIALATGGLILVGGWALGLYLKDAIGVGIVLTVGIWLWQVVDDRTLLRVREVFQNEDIDGDGYIGEPPREPQKAMRVTVTEERGNSSWTGYFDSPIEEHILGQFARACLAGRPMGERNWTGAGQPFSVNEYVDFRDELMGRGLVRWKNDRAHRQGFKLTLRGERVFKKLAAIPAPTPPELLR